MKKVDVSRASGPLAALLAQGLFACHASPPGLSLHTARLPLEGPCPTAEGSSPEWDASVTQLRVEVRTPEDPEVRTAEGAVGALTVERVPAGEGRHVTVFGLGDGGALPAGPHALDARRRGLGGYHHPGADRHRRTGQRRDAELSR
ncbi:MAG: hypothetical protein ACO3JL_10210, partial [Myxococcota bacterium]